MYSVLLLLLIVNFVGATCGDRNSPYIIIDGCPERNPEAGPNSKICRWDMGMCPICDPCGTPGPTRSVRTAKPSERPSDPPSERPSNIPSERPSESPTFITTIVNKKTPSPSESPSDTPSDTPSDVPSQFPTYISTGKVRCPSAKFVNGTA